jgi:SAM-dependent methyltransferase
MSIFTPERRRGIEYLDDPAVPPGVRERALSDVVRSNTLLGGAHAFLAAVREVLPRSGGTLSLLDVGTGLADLPRRTARPARRRGLTLTTIGCDAAESLLHADRERLSAVVCANALVLPFESGSVDVVTCSQLLHHFTRADAVRLVREMRRVARRAVIVSDLRRSWIAMAGFWLVSFPLGFHAVTRHDGVWSVLRGFTPDELASIVGEATGHAPRVRRRPGFRVTAVDQRDRP